MLRLVASIKQGTVTASLILRKLSAYPRQNGVAVSLREMGRIRWCGQSSSRGIYVFVSERKSPLTPDAVRKIVGRAGRKAGVEFSVHPHMLRHTTGYKLTNDGQDTRAIQHYLRHRNIQHTTRYAELSADRFKSFW